MIRYFVIVPQEFSVLNFVAMDKKIPAFVQPKKCPISRSFNADCEARIQKRSGIACN